jgi:hypothetical protein
VVPVVWTDAVRCSDFISIAGAEQDVLHQTPIEAHREQG